MTDIAERLPAADKSARKDAVLPASSLFSGVLLACVAGILVVAWIAFAEGGLDYYRTPLATRPYAPAHKVLRPSGPVGNMLGIAGTLCMLSTLLYIARKKVKRFSKLGSMKAWLEFHIFCGVFGPILITLHTSFRFNGIISVAYWSMLLVVLSGFVGRYLFVRIPKTIRGTELTRAELEQRATDLKLRLVDTGLPANLLRRIEEIEQFVASRAAEKRTFLQIFADALAARERMRALRHDLRISRLHPALMREALELLDERTTLLRRLSHLKRTKELFQLWHVFHRPLVWVMFGILLLHVGVAFYFGYTILGR